MLKLTIKYAAFAGIATLCNLLTQKLFDTFYAGPFPFFVALIAGTLIGLIVKYILDKRFIFYYVVKTKQEDVKKFILYSVMGVATTAIFWGFQIGFHLILKTEDGKYIGAIIGLIIGYFIKYQLDKRFVFVKLQQKVDEVEGK